ncbi:hypothetical protein [Hyphomicrobium methylovorum]|uniref:hypothetical protein n=1 Tax=Hyphomicrobium methylovorum TaxID=84 RepID=UPI0015E729E6|nr:hypothetical protein [Hyphomicrobium methylovorum]
MSDNPEATKVLDPDNVAEILCDGRFNISSSGGLLTLTFTQSRPRAQDLFEGKVIHDDIVRARITMTSGNVVALRDILNRVIKTPGEVPAAGGSASSTTKH